MQLITVSNRNQKYFARLEDQVSTNNPIRLTDAFIDKLELDKTGLTKTIYIAVKAGVRMHREYF